MANIKSAKKRINVNKRERNENRYVKSTLATMVKNFRKLLAEGKVAEAEAKLSETVSYIDSACSKGVIHKNNASRKISRLSSALDKAKATAPKATEKKVKKVEVEEVKEVKAEEVKAEPAKKTTKKTETEKATTKKAPAKKASTETKTTKKTTKKAEEK